MPEADTRVMMKKLDGLRTELVELSFVLEGRGQLDAADVAITPPRGWGSSVTSSRGRQGRPASSRG